MIRYPPTLHSDRYSAATHWPLTTSILIHLPARTSSKPHAVHMYIHVVRGCRRHTCSCLPAAHGTPTNGNGIYHHRSSTPTIVILNPHPTTNPSAVCRCCVYGMQMANVRALTYTWTAWFIDLHLRNQNRHASADSHIQQDGAGRKSLMIVARHPVAARPAGGMKPNPRRPVPQRSVPQSYVVRWRLLAQP